MGEPTHRDLRVHATNGAVEVVRYERAGKWYVEDVLGRYQVTLDEAVDRALALGEDAMRFGVPGGGAFDSRVRRQLALLEREA